VPCFQRGTSTLSESQRSDVDQLQLAVDAEELARREKIDSVVQEGSSRRRRTEVGTLSRRADIL
jgi:hypothetical protein